MRSDCINHFGLEEQSQEKNIERQVNRYFRGEISKVKNVLERVVSKLLHILPTANDLNKA